MGPFRSPTSCPQRGPNRSDFLRVGRVFQAEVGLNLPLHPGPDGSHLPRGTPAIPLRVCSTDPAPHRTLPLSWWPSWDHRAGGQGDVSPGPQRRTLGRSLPSLRSVS